jgi:hypothetical protein
MTNWTITLEGIKPGEEDDITFNFVDIRNLMEPQLVERYFIQDLSKNMKKNPHYHELANVKEANSDDEQSIPKETTALILATVKDTKEKFGILLSLANEFKYEIIGLRPDSFVEKIKKKNAELVKTLEKLVKKPSSFEDVNVVLPENRF